MAETDQEGAARTGLLWAGHWAKLKIKCSPNESDRVQTRTHLYAIFPFLLLVQPKAHCEVANPRHRKWSR